MIHTDCLLCMMSANAKCNQQCMYDDEWNMNTLLTIIILIEADDVVRFYYVKYVKRKKNITRNNRHQHTHTPDTCVQVASHTVWVMS